MKHSITLFNRVVLVFHKQIEGTTVAGDSLSLARFVGEGAAPFFKAARPVEQTQQERQMSTGRVSVGADAVRIEVIVPRVSPQPADRGLTVVQTGGKGSLAR